MAENPKPYIVSYDYSDAPTLRNFALSNKRVRLIVGPFGPLSNDTEFLTPTGWKKIEDYIVGDLVAQCDIDGNTAFAYPVHYIVQPCEEFIHFKTASLDMMVSPEHRVLVRDRYGKMKVRLAYEMHDRQHMWKTGVSDLIPMSFNFKNNTSLSLSEDELRLMVAVIADGSFHKHMKKENTTYNTNGCCMGFTKDRKKKRLRHLLAKLNIPYKESPSPKGVVYFYFQAPLKKKIYDSYFWAASYEQRKIICDEIQYWDGSRGGNGTIYFYSTAKESVDFIQYCFVSCGVGCTIRARNQAGGRWGKKVCYEAHSFRSPAFAGFPKKPEAINYEKYGNGYKYCFETKTGFFVARRNNKVFITGNSGKSSACVFEIIKRAHQQAPGSDGIRRSRWAIVRNTNRQLNDTTVKTFLEWFPPKIFGEYKITTHDYYITKFPGVHLEVMFRALDNPQDVSNLLSLELTGAWFNEAREISPAIIVAMDGRINRYPSMKDGGASWTGMIMDTNPPDDDSYLYKMFEKVKPKNWELFHQPSGLSAQAENTKHLAKNYYHELAQGKDEMYIRVYIHGQYGYLLSGRPVFTGFVDSVHVARNVLEPIKGVDLLIGIDFGLCYDDQTEVLTQSGWKLFKDVLADDLVATKDFTTNKLEYCKPSKRISRLHNGDMYLYENNNVNFCVTPEHIIPCRKKYGHYGKEFNGEYRLSAKFLYEETTTNYAVDLLAEWDGNSIGFFGPLEWESSVFAKFMGLYLSEGSCDKVHERISIAQNKRDKIFQTILDDTGLTWHRGARSWRTSNKKLNQYLQKFGYAKEKYIPQEVKNMNKEDILSFIFTYTRGDGHIRTRANGAEEHTIFTTSKTMADDFQELALKVGWYAKIRIVKPQDSVIFEKGKPRTIHNEGGYSITFKKRSKQIRLLKRYFKKIYYRGDVYCLTVPYGTLYVRRKWTPSWNGNSPAVTIGQITPLGQLRIIDELVSEGNAIKQFCINQLLPLLRTKYFGYNVMGYGDPAGNVRSQTDESTCFDVLHSSEIGLININEAPTNSIVARINSMEKFLNKMTKGEPGFLLSPNCTFLRKALNGGYHYALERTFRGGEQEWKQMPLKNFSSHISDSVMYLTLYIDTKEEYDKQRKEFLGCIKQKQYIPGDYISGY